MFFDSILDPKVKRAARADVKGKAYWIWYPGQRTAHIHKAKLKEAQERFRSIGYPGTFRQPEYRTYFRAQLNLVEDEELIWHAPEGRLRVVVDGRELDITDRSCALAAGCHTFFAVLDFADSLPCFLMEGETVQTDQRWEVSLDGRNWVNGEWLEDFRSPEQWPLMETTEILSITPVSVESVEKGGVLVDFGYYELGEVTVSARGEGGIQIIVGQSIEEVLEDDLESLEQIQSKPEQLSEQWVDYRSCRQALRYAYIGLEGETETKDITFEASVWPVEYFGEFSTDDSMISDCWATGVSTVHSCMQEFYLDAIYRDALPWALDGVCAMEAANLVFRDQRIGRQHLQSQMLPMDSTVEDLGSVYLDFQLYTLFGIAYDYMFWKDEAYLRQCWPLYEHTLTIYGSLMNSEGFLDSKSLPGSIFFPDWAVSDETGPDGYGVPAYVQMLLMTCYEFGAYSASLLGDEAQSDRYNILANDLRRHIMEHFYDDRRCVFINGYRASGEKDERATIFAQVFGILYELFPEGSYDGLEGSLRDGTVLRHESISLNWYFELQALCRMGQADMALASIRQHAGGILEQGDIRLYEDINRSGERTLDFYGRPYGKSLCHSIMGAAPVTALSREVLGIRPVRTPELLYTFNPARTSLKKVHGKVATPTGVIAIEITGDTALIQLPAGVRIETENGWRHEQSSVISGKGTFILSRRVES